MTTQAPRLEEIFATLSKGEFISSNSNDSEMREYFNLLDDDFETYYEYYVAIGFKLERGNEYFHFSRLETKAEFERKLQAVYKWIDILDFFKTWNPAFGPGTRITPAEIAQKCAVTQELKLKLEAIKGLASEGNLVQRIKKLIEELRKDRFVELESELLDTWKVLTAEHYLERLIELITIHDEDEAVK